VVRAIRRLGAVPAATLLFGSLFTLAAPAAHADCYYGSQFTGVTTGYLTWSSEEHYWSVESNGTTVIQLTATDSSIGFHAYGENCDYLGCDHVTQCVATHTGTISLYVHGGTGDYVLTAAGTDVPGVPDVGTPPGSGCNLVNTLGVCVGLEAGAEIERVTVREPVVGFTDGPGVVGRVEQWRLPLPTGGSVLLPCVVLTVDGQGSNGCSLLGASYVSTVSVLVNDDVPIPTAGFGDVLATVGLCEAQLTATVVGFGVEDVPAVTLC
jgi:hypothetical protein